MERRGFIQMIGAGVAGLLLVDTALPSPAAYAERDAIWELLRPDGSFIAEVHLTFDPNKCRRIANIRMP